MLEGPIFQIVVLGALAVIVLALLLIVRRLGRFSARIDRMSYNHSVDNAVRMVEGLNLEREVKKVTLQALEGLYRHDTPAMQQAQRRAERLFVEEQRRTKEGSRQ